MADFCPWPGLPAPRNIPLISLEEHPCPYLPGRVARNRAFVCEQMPADLYHQCMDAGFRRSGKLVYQPVCAGCRACQPIRVPVESFVPSKSQRRAWRRNADLMVDVSAPQPTQEKFDLYQRYLLGRHDRSDEQQTPQDFIRFLYDSPVESIEFAYRLPDTPHALIGVGICDVCEGRSLSSVYFYFDPVHARRGLGTFSTLWEIDFARRRKIPHYYLGYFVAGCRSMSYKAQFRPNQLLHPDGAWRANSPPPGS